MRVAEAEDTVVTVSRGNYRLTNLVRDGHLRDRGPPRRSGQSASQCRQSVPMAFATSHLEVPTSGKRAVRTE